MSTTTLPEILDCGHPPDKGEPYNGGMGWQFVSRDGKKICHACDSLRVLSCGHHPSPHSFVTTGAAWIGEGENKREICYECANAMQREELRDRSKPFSGYISGDGKTLSTWTGGELGRVMSSWEIELTRLSFTHGKTIRHYRVKDCHGAWWHGRGNPGLCITLRPMKTPIR